MEARAWLAGLALLHAALGSDNGRALTPPMGWRSWNQFQGAISQAVMERAYRGLADRSRPVWAEGGERHASLADLGYTDAGLDDGWQACGSYGPDQYRYHTAAGDPVVNTDRFPDMRAMTSLAHSLNLTAGWYGNACGCADGCCSDHCDTIECFAGDVNATLAYGFDSYKVDGCGAQRDVALWDRLFNHSLRDSVGMPMMLENCHDGDDEPEGNAQHYTPRGELWCPCHMYRTSGDARPTYGSVLSNLNTTRAYAAAKLSVPGCWAYPDMLEVGVTRTGIGAGSGNNCGPTLDEPCPPLSVTEARTHFGAWCIVSSPLVIGFDFADAQTVDAHWATVTNTDAIEVNQDYAGEAGTRFQASADTAEFPACGWGATYPGRTNASCTWPSTMGWAKRLSGRDGRRSIAAVLLMNNGPDTTTLSFAWSDRPWPLDGEHGRAGVTGEDAGCHVYDVWERISLGRVGGAGLVVEGVAAHDSVFVTLSNCTALPARVLPS